MCACVRNQNVCIVRRSRFDYAFGRLRFIDAHPTSAKSIVKQRQQMRESEIGRGMIGKERFLYRMGHTVHNRTWNVNFPVCWLINRRRVCQNLLSDSQWILYRMPCGCVFDDVSQSHTHTSPSLSSENALWRSANEIASKMPWRSVRANLWSLLLFDFSTIWLETRLSYRWMSLDRPIDSAKSRKISNFYHRIYSPQKLSRARQWIILK